MINVGVIGLGRAGWENHVLPLVEHPFFRLAAVADPVPERVAEAVRLTGCTGYDDYRELLADRQVQVAVIASPTHLHMPMTLDALQAGKHVLVEKPMAASLAEVDAVMEAARRAGQVLTVFQNRRLDPDFLAIRHWIESGRLGRVSLVKIGRHSFNRRSDWQTLRKFGGGLLANWGAHLVDWSLLLSPDAHVRFADLRRTVSAGDAEDHVKILMKPDGEGPAIDIEIVQDCAFVLPTWVVMGEYGSILGDEKSLTVKWCDPADLSPLTADEGPAVGRSYARNEPAWTTEEIRLDGYGQGHFRSHAWYVHLYESLSEGKPLLVTPESVRRQVAALEEVRRLSGF
jgi:scyllo-inositol 2-dehydrogenase (NADP+)